MLFNRRRRVYGRECRDYLRMTAGERKGARYTLYENATKAIVADETWRMFCLCVQGWLRAECLAAAVKFKLISRKGSDRMNPTRNVCA